MVLALPRHSGSNLAEGVARSKRTWNLWTPSWWKWPWPAWKLAGHCLAKRSVEPCRGRSPVEADRHMYTSTKAMEIEAWRAGVRPARCSEEDWAGAWDSEHGKRVAQG